MNIKANEEYFRYLYELQNSGETNMFGAGQYLRDTFGIDRKTATDILTFWMQNYEEIAKELNIDI